MVELNTQNLPSSLTIKMVIQEALARGWKAWAYTLNEPHAILERPDGVQVPIYSSCPPTTSYEAAYLADNKFLTHEALQDKGLPVLPTFRCETDDQAQQAVHELISKGHAYVVKPLDGAHGNGITLGLNSIEQLPEALAYARRYSKIVIVQQLYKTPVDLRVLCINYKVVAALERIPARVTGTGSHTVEQLIAQQNQNRAEQYTGGLSKIPIERATEHLGQAVYGVPEEGQVVSVLGLANIGLGGEGRNVTQALPVWMIEDAEQAARALRLPVCGVDFLVLQAPAPDFTRDQLAPVITELNMSPSLFMHEMPYHGSPEPVVKKYVDYLTTL